MADDAQIVFDWFEAQTEARRQGRELRVVRGLFRPEFQLDGHKTFRSLNKLIEHLEETKI